MSKKILLVEDDLFIRELYQRVLTNAGFEVIIAVDGEQGLTLAKDKPALMLLDIMMPKMNGMDVLKKLKEGEDTKNIPVILLTNLGQESVMEEAMALGAIDYIIKVSHTPDQIVEKVKEVVNDGSS